MPAPRRRSAGFTYLGLMILVAIIGIAAAATLQLGAAMQRRDAEEQLLDIGRAYRNAFDSYASVTPAGQLPAPRTLQDLLRDPRFGTPVRHLRNLYPDPLTHGQPWGLVLGPDQRVLGVYSLSPQRPLKVARFDPPFEHFKGSASYRDWVFSSAADGGGSAAPAVSGAGTAPPAGTPMNLAPASPGSN